MLIRRAAALSAATIHNLRRFSTAALLQEVEAPPLYTYLDGLPTPDPKYDVTIHAIPRVTSGKSIAAKERKAGRIPSIVFEAEDGQHGGNKRLISVESNQIKKLVNHLGRPFFLSRLFDLEVRPEFGSGEVVENVRVLPRQVCLFICRLWFPFFFFGWLQKEESEEMCRVLDFYTVEALD